MATTAATGPYAVTSSALSLAAGRMSYVLDLRGPSLAIETSCSSTLVAAHTAVHLMGPAACGAALVTGVNLILRPAFSYVTARAAMTSPLGRCHTFDARADGFTRAEAVIAASCSHGTSRARLQLSGSSVHQDGRGLSLTAPNGQAQVALLKHAHVRSDLEMLCMLEAHGTGTALGDPIEVGALGAVFVSRSYPLPLHGIKANSGHAESAAGGQFHGLLLLLLGCSTKYLTFTVVLTIDYSPLSSCISDPLQALGWCTSCWLSLKSANRQTRSFAFATQCCNRWWQICCACLVKWLYRCTLSPPGYPAASAHSDTAEPLLMQHWGE